MNGALTISAIILTYNEERHIRECLESVTWCDEIWVVDSFSTDRTLEISREYTDSIVQHPFEDFAKQRNWALDNLPLTGEWVLFVDADESVPEGLAQEIQQRLGADKGRYAGYYIAGEQYFWREPLHFGTAAPDYHLKLFRRDAGRYSEEKIVHESLRLDGEIGFMKHPRRVIAKENLREYIDRVNWYSNLEAIRMFTAGEEIFSPRHPSYTWVNQFLKHIFRYLPLKPVAMFIFVYVLRQGFRDGYRGLLYAVMESFYVFASYAKLWEIRKGLVSPQEYRLRH